MSSGFGGYRNHVTALSVVHARTHQGTFFGATAEDAALANGANLDMLIRVGAETMHANFALVAGGNAAVALFEGTTISAEGSVLTPQNHNRTSSRASNVLLNQGSTITLPGTKIAGGRILGGTGGNADGGATDTNDEWLLAPNTSYLLRLTNNSGQVQAADIHVRFYEDIGNLP